MATLTVLKFESAEGAGEALETVKSLSKQHLINLQDASVVTCLAGMGALDGAFWGMLFGMIFFVPFFGMAIGAAMGALSGKFADYGIDDDFIKSVQDQVTEGTSALFLMTSDAIMDKVADAFEAVEFELIASNLSKEQEDELRAAFA
jgi:uncharacterized membrane protein